MDYDSNPITVHTAYTFEQVRKYQGHHFGSSRRPYLVLATVFLAIILVSILTGSTLVPSLFWMGIAIIVVLSLSVLSALIQSFGLNYTKKKHEAITARMRNGHTYSFRNTEFDIETNNPDYKSNSTCSYKLIHRVGEDKSMLYLYIDTQTAYLVDKQGLQSGTPEELRQLLLKNIPANKCKFLKHRT